MPHLPDASSRRKFLCVVAGTFILLCLPPPAYAGGRATDVALIKTAVRKMDEAANRKDAAGYVAFTHPDFIYINKQGDANMHGKADRRSKIAAMFSHTTQIKVRTLVNRITFSRETATVKKSTTGFLVVIEADKRTEFKGAGTHRDVWVKTVTRWLQK